MNNELTFEEFWADHKETDSETKKLFEISEQISELINTINCTRVDKNYSQRDLAKMCGLKQSAIARFESLKAMPRLDTLMNIVYTLGLKIKIEDENKKNQQNNIKNAG